MPSGEDLTLDEKVKALLDHRDLLDLDAYEEGFLQGMETILIAIEEDKESPLEKFLTQRQQDYIDRMYTKYEEQIT